MEEKQEDNQIASASKQSRAPKKARPSWPMRLIRYIKREMKKRKAEKEKESSADRNARITARATKWMAIFTLILAGVGIATLCVLRNQLHEMQSGGIDTHTLAQQAVTQAIQTTNLASAAGKQADASKALADLTAKQFAASQQLIESQRASITVSFGRVINPITFHEGSASIVFSILLQNTGAMKATHVAVRFKPYYSVWGSNIFTEPLQKQRDFCATRSAPPPDWGWQDGKRIDLKGLRDWTVTVEPHTLLERQLNFGMGKPTDAEIIKWPPADAIQRNPTLLVTDRIFPVVVGCVDYQSGVMPEKHQTGFIFEVQEAYSDVSAPNAAPTFIHYGVDAPRERVVITQFYFGQGKQY